MLMSASADRLVEQVVDNARYPLRDPSGTGWRDVVSRVRQDLHTVGCSVLPDFVRPALREALRRECEEIAPRAYYDVETVNAYNTDADPSLPDGHPARMTIERGNAFVARDCIPEEFIIHRLYTSPLFQLFVARCFALPQVHELADPLSGLCLNVIAPGRAHPWHFDTNEFTVSMVTQEPEAGGVFEYCPNIRSARAENFEDVRAVLAGREIHGDRHVAARQVDRGPVLPGRTSLAHPDAVDGDAELVGLECGAGGADRREYPAPVRVLATDCALDQIAPRYRAADLDRVVLGGRAGHLDRDGLARALGVRLQLPGQVCAGPG